MSGGVDSSVAAALLKDEGHEVTGVTMRLFSSGDSKSNGNLPDSVEKAGEVAGKLGIPHHIIDLTDFFHDKVITDFCREYSRGRTPNPCITCNRYIKFEALMEKAVELGADSLATGHYARVEKDAQTGKYLLKKGTDTTKDQSYFLYRLLQEQLAGTRFPVGSMTKDRVKRMAGEMNLPVADRPESQEICFIPGGKYIEFLENNLPEPARPGPIISESGENLGEHRGIYSYTIGQRRGTGIASAEPLYVTAIEPERNIVVVGPRESIYSNELTAYNLNWISGEVPELPGRLKARIRYRHPEAEATITPEDNNTVRVVFAEPQMAITPGQSVVFYDGDTVIGGGIIQKSGK
jgi:tRNA-specific 2-thiouridylase